MAVAVSATGTATYNASAATQNYTFTVNASDTLAVFYLVQDAGQTITSVTWDQGGTNQACSLVKSQVCATSSNGAVYIYAVVNPTSGTKTLRVVQTATALSAELQSYTGTVTTSVAAACTNALGATGTNTSGTFGTAAQAGASGDMYVSAYSVNGTISSVSDTTIYNLTPAGNDASGNRFPSAGASHALTVTITGTTAWAAASCDIVASTGANLTNFWYAPWREPVRIKTSLAASGHQYLAYTGAAPFPETVTESHWHQPWSEPPKPKAGLSAHQQQAQPYFETARFPEIVSEDRWHQPWNDPPKPKAGLATSQQQALALTEAAPFPEIVSEDRWHQPWSEPVRRATNAALQSTTTFTAVTSTASVDGWGSPLSEPQRQLLGLPAREQQTLALTKAAPFPETVSEDRWHQPWSEPVRRATVAALQSTTTFTTVVATTPTPIIAFTDPPRPKVLATAQQQVLAYTEAAPFPETVSEDRWHQPWSDPVRIKPSLPAGEQPALAFVSVTTTTPSVDGWGSPLSEPVRKTGFLPHYAKGKSFFSTAPETVFVSDWFAPLSEPLRTKSGIQAAQQQPLAYGNFTPAGAVQWWETQWADPVQHRVKWTTAETPVGFAAVTQAQTPWWLHAWSEPVRTRNLGAQQQQLLAWPPAIVAQAQVGVDSWIEAWSEPVRRPFSPSYTKGKSFFSTAPEAVSEDRWHQPWSEPVRAKPGTTAALQQTLAQTLGFTATPSIDGWLQPWVDPPKPKVSLNVAAQQALAQSPNFTVVTPSFGYFSAFSEPQRQLAGLAARYQQDAAYGFVPIVQQFVFFFGNEEPLPWPGFRGIQFIRENFDQLAFPPFPIPNPPVTQAKFTVSGPSVSDLFPVSGVIYPYAPETRKTVP